MKKVITSKKFHVDLRDLVHSLIVAGVTAALGTGGQMIEVWLNSPSFSLDKVSVVLTLKAAIAGAGGYLIKKFVTPAQSIAPAEERNLNS